MEKERISYHESVLRVYERIKKDGMSNVWDRYEAQGVGGNPDQRCPFLYGRSALRLMLQRTLSRRCCQG
jgi:carbon-monoxide dehydrogenase catalytic subunit